MKAAIAEKGHDDAQSEPAPVTDGHERRRSPRQPARDLSEIWIAGGRAAVTCLVRDISREGAQVEAESGLLPDRFVLTNYARRCRVICEVVWRRKRRLGVRFATPVRSLD